MRFVVLITCLCLLKCKDPNASGMDVSIRMRPIVQQFSVIYNQLMEEREEEAKRNNTKIHIMPHQFNECSDLLVAIWNDDAIREVFERRRELPKYYVENVPYFIESIQKISRKVFYNTLLDQLTATTNETIQE